MTACSRPALARDGRDGKHAVITLRTRAAHGVGAVVIKLVQACSKTFKTSGCLWHAQMTSDIRTFWAWLSPFAHEKMSAKRGRWIPRQSTSSSVARKPRPGSGVGRSEIEAHGIAEDNLWPSGNTKGCASSGPAWQKQSLPSPRRRVHAIEKRSILPRWYKADKRDNSGTPPWPRGTCRARVLGRPCPADGAKNARKLVRQWPRRSDSIVGFAGAADKSPNHHVDVRWVPGADQTRTLIVQCLPFSNLQRHPRGRRTVAEIRG